LKTAWHSAGRIGPTGGSGRESILPPSATAGARVFVLESVADARNPCHEVQVLGLIPYSKRCKRGHEGVLALWSPLP